MESEVTFYTREDLYLLVWSVPMMKLAKKHGLSDRGLAKICKRYDIPCPPRGYWAKVQAGQKAKKTPLPKRKSLKQIKLRNKAVEKPEKGVAEDFIEKNLNNPITVKQTLRGANPLIKQTSDYFKRSSKKLNQMLAPPLEECLDVTVSPKNLKRALLIMDAVLKTLEDIGVTIFLSDSATKVELFDVNISFAIKEEFKTVHKKPKDRDLKLNLQFDYESRHSFYNYDHVPSGILCLTINEYVYGSRTQQKNWRDTKTLILEDRLVKFVSGLIKTAACKSENRKRQEEKDRKRNELKGRLKQKAVEIEIEKARIDRIHKHADNWNKAQILRQYISEVKKKISGGVKLSFIEGKADEWLEWAYKQADRIDPLKPNSFSVVDDEEALEEAWRKLRWW